VRARNPFAASTRCALGGIGWPLAHRLSHLRDQGLTRELVLDGLGAGLRAALISGAPSTLDALVGRADPLAAPVAAGTILLPSERRTGRLLLASVPVHLTVSSGWAIALTAVLPRHATVAFGAAAGLAIGVLDIAVIGRWFPRIRALALGPQIADHVAFGAVVGAVVRRGRERRPSESPLALRGR
jgi:hypothetical protein